MLSDTRYIFTEAVVTFLGGGGAQDGARLADTDVVLGEQSDVVLDGRVK